MRTTGARECPVSAGAYGLVMLLEISTSPRSTWLWANDAEQAEQLRELLTAAGCEVYSAAGQNAEPRILDLDIGVVAGEGLMALAAEGYGFIWHHSQHVLNRGQTVLGVPIVDTP